MTSLVSLSSPEPSESISAQPAAFPWSMVASRARHWYAVFTLPQHEKTVDRHLAVRQIESFLPTYIDVRCWKNRQRMRIVRPLFPTYLFVHVTPSERRAVLPLPGVVRMVGDRTGPIPLPHAEIELLRQKSLQSEITPFCDPLIGQRVRIVRGAFAGVEGVVVRHNNRDRFVLTLPLIHQHAALEVEARDLAPA